ncbi:hypothetical protein Btru_058563 [Bulinus truncatus]|nr:hypothetical protein Btru_058563 [Bulinus truncatus]
MLLLVCVMTTAGTYAVVVLGSTFHGMSLYKGYNPFTTLWSSSATLTTYYPTESVTECAMRCVQEYSTCRAISFEPTNSTCTLGQCVITQPIARNATQTLHQTLQPFCNLTLGFNLHTEGTTSACLWWSDLRKNAADAKMDCKDKGAILSIFKSLEKFTILQKRNERVYIGLDDVEVEGVFRWHDDGSVLDLNSSYSKQIFLDGELNNMNDQDCVIFYNGELLDCQYADLNFYVCEQICFYL